MPMKEALLPMKEVSSVTCAVHGGFGGLSLLFLGPFSGAPLFHFDARSTFEFSLQMPPLRCSGPLRRLHTTANRPADGLEIPSSYGSMLG